MFADGTFRAVGTRRLDRETLGRLLSPALDSGQVDRMAGSESGRYPVHPVDTMRFGSRYGTYSRVDRRGNPRNQSTCAKTSAWRPRSSGHRSLRIRKPEAPDCPPDASGFVETRLAYFELTETIVASANEYSSA